MATFYIDTQSFATATAAWEDPNLTIKAPDGFYSFFGVYRQQFNGFLLNTIDCTPEPTDPCVQYSADALGFPGNIYYVDCDGTFQEVFVETSFVFCAIQGTVSSVGPVISITTGTC